MANTDFGILLKTLLDKSDINSELEQVQKIVNKYSIDIMPELKTASLRNQMKAVSQEIANDFNKVFGTNLTGNDVFKAFENQAKQAKKELEDQAKAAKKAAEEQAKAIEEARKAQEKHNEAVRKGKELAKKQADDQFTSKQTAIYDDIKKNQSQIYLLKQKLLSADKLETEEINKQISALELKNKYNNYKLTKNGMVDSLLEKSVQESRAVLENQYKIADTRKQDNANAKESARIAKETAKAEKELTATLERRRAVRDNSAKEKAKFNAQQELAQQREVNAILSKQESAYKEIWNINKQISKLDEIEDVDIINALKEKKKFYQDIYLSAQKELQAYNNIIVSQEHLASLADIRKKAESEIGVITAKQNKAQADKVNEIQLQLDTEKYSKDIKDISDELAKVGKFTLSDQSNVDIFDKAQKSAKSLDDTYKLLKTTMADANATDQQKIDIENKYQQELTTTKNLLSQIKLSKDDESIAIGDNRRVNMVATLNNYLAKNTAMTKESKKQIEVWIETIGSSDDLTVGALKNINSKFKELDSTLRKTGKLGLSNIDKFKQAAEKFGGWSLVTGAITRGTTEITKAVTELKEIDDILTEISKTSDLTEKQLKKLGNTSLDTASKYGKKASDYLVGVQEMYRAGFDNADEMAELSVLAQAAGDMEKNSANDYLMATNAAYDYKGSVEDLNKVLDSQNYITNNAAVSMQDMADATSEAASIAAQYGVEIDELSALIAVATSKTRESGAEVGTALKALLINLQDTTSKPIRSAFEDVGISMTKIVDGSEQLKTPIELIKELSVAFNSLPEGDVKRANILNDIGGKHHANTLAAILSNLESYNSMLELYNNNAADGSAFKEAEKSANNWSGSVNKLSNSWTSLVQNFANSDTIIYCINLLNDLVKTIDKLGAAGTIGLGAGLFAGFKNVGRDKKCFPLCFKLPTMISVL